VYDNPAAAVERRRGVLTMLPHGDAVKRCYDADILPRRNQGALFSSTAQQFPSMTHREVHASAGLPRVGPALTAPVSGGVKGAVAAPWHSFRAVTSEELRARIDCGERWPAKIILAERAGAGQAAKVCHTIVLPWQQIAIGERSCSPRKLSLSRSPLFYSHLRDRSTAGRAHPTARCPCPVPTHSPSTHDFTPGFAHRADEHVPGFGNGLRPLTGVAAPLGQSLRRI